MHGELTCTSELCCARTEKSTHPRARSTLLCSASASASARLMGPALFASASACASREARGEAEKSGPDADLRSLFAPSPDGGLAVQDVYLYITLGMRRLLGDSSLS